MVVRRDAIFYQLFVRYPQLIFELVDLPIAERQGYRFDSVEVKEPTFRIDGVFLPPESSRVVVFAEVQFQKDQSLYHRLFSEAHLYLHRNRKRYDDWYAVVILASRSVEPDGLAIHRSLLNHDQVYRIYLDELGDSTQQSVGISLMLLTIASEDEAAEQARRLIDRANQEPIENLPASAIIELVTTIAVYKFSQLSRDEVEAMLGLRLEETRIYREAKAEGKLEMILKLLEFGDSIEKVAEVSGLPPEEIQKIAQQRSK
ncbi:Rpn family recombination-promoting nuclease/putative transposase [Leptolyngbya sp. AN03gr2]|uniref:Rpn family recombination-promoting nuclease/putative transposase n=1 Tax=unclassified Leptolyngbya TaxID=2650499 RepID=UPI003D31182E